MAKNNHEIHDHISSLLNEEIGPIEIEEKNSLFWNCVEWPNYIKCSLNTELSSLVKIIQEGWCLNRPQIILSILSDYNTLNKWQNFNQIKNFQIGLVKAASSAKMWIISNGINIGASRIVSEAIVNEQNWQSSLIDLGEELEDDPKNKFRLNNIYKKTTKTTFINGLLKDKHQLDLMNLDINLIKKKDELNTKHTKLNKFNKHIKLNTQTKLCKHTNSIPTNLTIMKCVIIGIINENRIIRNSFVQKQFHNIDKPKTLFSTRQNLNKENLNIFKEQKFAIDENHSHFIFVNDIENEHHLTTFEQIIGLELFYELSYLGTWLMSKQPSNLQQRITIQKVKNLRIPFIAILMQGDYETAITCCNYLLKQIPVLVLQGTGGFSDLLAYAYNELNIYLGQQKYCGSQVNPNLSETHIQFEPFNLNVPNEYMDKVLKPALRKRIKLYFSNEIKEKPSKANLILEKIIECVFYANQEGNEYLTLLNVNNPEINLEQLDEYLLYNYLKCRQANFNEASIRPQEELDNDLKLTINWNSCKIAGSILSKHLNADYLTIDKSLFLDAITKPNREAFVKLFLDFGFKMRTTFNIETLTWLMHKSSKKHLFLLICCENILNIPYNLGFPLEHDMITNLNKLFSITCNLNKFLNLNELTNRYKENPSCIEQKALIFFTVWSIFNYNIELAKHLWPFSAFPIHLLLIIAKVLNKMSDYTYEMSLCREMQQHAYYFSKQASDLLNLCHRKSDSISVNTLSEKYEHFNNFTAIDMAVDIKHYPLLEHQSTQKWMDYKLLNGIHLKQSALGDLSKSFKILFSVIFVLPILIWFDYPHHVKQKKNFMLNKNKLTNLIALNKTNVLNVKLKDECKFTFKKANIWSNFKWLLNAFKKRKSSYNAILARSKTRNYSLSQSIQTIPEQHLDLSLFEKWLHLINSPMSKYVLNLFVWIIFLVFFSYVLTKPGCGDFKLNMILFVWIILHVIDLMRKTIIKLQTFMSANYEWHLFECLLSIAFLIHFYFNRLTYSAHGQPYSYNGRIMMCCVLFFAYVKLVTIFMPMFNKLGPLSFRIRMMSIRDVLIFLGLVWPFMIGFAVIIDTSIYPDRFILNDNLYIQTIIHRSLFSLFRTPSDEIVQTNDTCEKLRSNPIYNETHCQIGQYQDVNCANQGFFPHLFLIFYLLLLKIVMLTLLYALFNASMFQFQTNAIWRYQRFFLIIDFDLNYPLPPPFSFLFYIYYLVLYLVEWLPKKLLPFILRVICLRSPRQMPNVVDTSANNNKYNLNRKKAAFVCKHCSNKSTIYFWKCICKEFLAK